MRAAECFEAIPNEQRYRWLDIAIVELSEDECKVQDLKITLQKHEARGQCIFWRTPRSQYFSKLVLASRR